MFGWRFGRKLVGIHTAATFVAISIAWWFGRGAGVLPALVAMIVALAPSVLYIVRVQRRLAQLARFAAEVAEEAPNRQVPHAAYDELDDVEANLARVYRFLGPQLAEARSEQRKFRALLSGMLEGVLVIDRAEVIQLANDRAAQLLGATDSRALLGAPVINVSREPNLQEALRLVLSNETGEPTVTEVTIRTGDREEILQLTANAIPGVDGGRPLYILVFHDVTELKKLEATRRDFVANVSHEIRTPLTAIRGYAETLNAGALDDPARARKFLGVIERHAERLARLTDDLLALSDLELGRAALHKVPMSLSPAVETALDVIREKAAQGSVVVKRELAAELPTFEADPDRLVQVLVNLADNAVKYTEPGGTVTVAGRLAQPPEVDKRRAHVRSWLEIAVADTGVGIPSRDLPRLTERFYRVDKARSRELGGTGLGLAIVKHIVQAHAGVLHIDSILGKGTTVKVYLPLGGDA